MPQSSNIPAKQAPGFTVQDFVRSMNDKPQWFDLFYNQAIGIGVNLGFDETESSELSLVALLHIYNNLGKYDPQKGEFKPWFDTCAKFKMIDEHNRYNHESDMLSDSMYSRSGSDGGEEKGKPVRVNDETSARCSEQRTNEEESDTRKLKEFTDGFLKECIDFVDSLSPVERMIVYASEFGHILVGTEGERNYAEILSEKTGSTVESIRKVASRRKQQAIKYAQDRGYDRQAYGSLLGYITVRQPEKKHFADFDWSRMSDVQLLKLRRYIYEKGLKDGAISADWNM